MLVFPKGAERRLFLWLALLTACGLTSAANADKALCPPHATPEPAQVRYVHDGDTVHLQDGRKIRLIGIDTPEVARGSTPAEAFANDARNRLRGLLENADNRVGLVYGEEREDRYGRTLAHLFSPGGRNLQAVLLQEGLATAVVFPPNTRYTDCYRETERNARCSATGQWSDQQRTPQEAAALADDARGFHLVTGKVEEVSKTGRGIWLFLADDVMVGVRTEDLEHFDTDALFALDGSRIVVRGWLNPRTPSKDKPVRHYIRVRHPSALESPLTCSRS